ncbi:PBECR2 nuclease fold domain-containing protein [Campylobacter sp. P091]|uniref:LPD3 domain-containing protein n=1 Tax=Campylobacter sp. P091 TaxID=1895621 RepID=UPI000A35804F|nr:PBECR2 nuclease fold domain-containing protein [Campylobacter sp. P091]
MAEIYTVRSILGDESLQNLINQGKSQDEIISIAKAYKDEAIKSGDKDALNRMNLVSQKQGRADFFTRLGDKMDANGYETMGSIARGIDILASKAAAPIAGLMGDSDKEAQILADMKLTQSINEAKNLDKIATTPRTQREYQIDSNNLLGNAIGSYTKDSKTYARNLIEQAENSGYTAMDRFNIGMATTANATKYVVKSFLYGEDSKEANDIKDAQKILQASRDAYEANNPDKWNVANFAGEMVTDPLNAVGLAKGFKVANTAFKKGANVAFDLAQLGAIGGMAGAISEYGSYKDKDEQNVAGAAMMGAGAGVALGAGFMALGAVLNKIASRFGQKSTLEQNAQIAKDETTKELEKGTPQDIDKRLQKISDDIEEAFSADENAENIARLLGQEYDDNINKAIKESQEVSTAIDSSVAKFANDNPKASASDIEIYINKTYAPSESEKELTRIINDDKPVTPRMAGYRVLGVLQKSMEYKTRFDRDTIVKRFKNHGFSDELANIFADAYIADDISVARRYLDSKVASNRQKSVEDGRNEWLKNTTKSDKAKTPKNQDEILKEISSNQTQFKLIDDSDMTAELKSRLENDGYTLEREPESGVWEISKAMPNQEIKETLAKPKELYGKFRNNVKNILNKLIGIDITNKNDGRIAQVSKTNISKMISDKAIQKSLNNGFSAKEHFEAVESVEELYKNAIYKSSSDDIKNGDKALKIHRYEADFKDNAKVLITLKESIDKNQNRIYTLEVDAVESKLSTKAPENKHSALNSDVKDFDSSVGSEASFITTADSANDKTISNKDLKSTDVVNVSDEIGINSTKGNFKSNPLSTPYSDAGLAVKAQDTRDGVRPNASIAKTDDKTIPNQDLKSTEFAELTFQDKKGKDHIITKEIQKEWIDTFGLKNLDDTYIPKFNNEIKKALGNKELKLQKGSLLKLVSQGRQKFIPEIKRVLDDPEIIITDKNGEIILAKHLKDKDYFVNVSFDNGEYLISISNGIKEINNLNNKIKQGGRILYQSPNANSISQTLLQTSQYSANKIDVAPVSTPKNDLDRTLSNRYDSSNSTPKEIKSQGLNLSRAERRAMGIQEPKGKTLVIDEKAVKSDVREFGRLAHQVGLGFKSAKEAKAVMDKCDKSKFDCGS